MRWFVPRLAVAVWALARPGATKGAYLGNGG
jgi:hypothetical protein